MMRVYMQVACARKTRYDVIGLQIKRLASTTHRKSGDKTRGKTNSRQVEASAVDW